MQLELQILLLQCKNGNGKTAYQNPKTKETNAIHIGDGDENIIVNPNFDDGLNNWSGRGCNIVLHDSMGDGKVLPLNGKYFVAATNRTQNWNGIQQDITGGVQRKLLYEVTATVRIFEMFDF
ncbi:hypothetical protein ACMD2_04661 [Ananas comosus]|uniref:CBM-cenC domain-containing protein n=1 Tax=Ananas comosus TaxID=4615 RepID=A0A199VWD9_ANACO|nr:hypothetical protein ACMD2_04661 [Ananas comosus]